MVSVRTATDMTQMKYYRWEFTDKQQHSKHHCTTLADHEHTAPHCCSNTQLQVISSCSVRIHFLSSVSSWWKRAFRWQSTWGGMWFRQSRQRKTPTVRSFCSRSCCYSYMAPAQPTQSIHRSMHQLWGTAEVMTSRECAAFHVPCQLSDVIKTERPS